MLLLLFACTSSEPVDFPVYRYSHSGGMGPDGRYLYTVGGSGLGGKDERDDAWRYDLELGAWEPLTGPPAQVFRASWALAGDTAYVHGGSQEASNTDTDQLLAWDLSAQTWTQVDVQGDKPSARFKEAAVWTGERLLVYGGQNDDGSDTQTFGELWSFDPQTQTWEQLTQSGGPGALTRVGLAWDAERGVLWLSGGIDSEGERHAWLWSYDLQTEQWTQAADDTAAPGVRASHTLVEIGGLLYVWAGQGQDDAVWVFDPGSGSWREVSGSAPLGRDAQVTGVVGSKIYIFGGDPSSEDAPDFVNDLWVFDTEVDAWTELEAWQE